MFDEIRISRLEKKLFRVTVSCPSYGAGEFDNYSRPYEQAQCSQMTHCRIYVGSF